MRICKTLLYATLPALLVFTGAQAQKNKSAKIADTVKTAQVIVTVVNDKKAPRKGEQILFLSHKDNKVYTRRTDAGGKATLALPAGQDYSVILKSITDSTQYGNLTVPPLGEGEYFTDPLTVDITYEPARVFTLNNLQFDVGKATIRPSSLGELQELLEYLQWKTDDKIEIAGHTDNVGKDDDNLVLSQQRADAVKNWLVKKGISPLRITAKGYGATQPVADNSDEEGRQKNRRTEVRIL